MGQFRSGSLGDLVTTGAGTAADVSDCEQVGVTVTFSAIDGSALHLEYAVGTTWYDAPGVGTFKSASFTESGSYLFPAGVNQIRGYVDTANGATMYVRWAGRDLDQVD